MKDNADPRRIHSAVCVTVQMTRAARAPSRGKGHDGKHHFAALPSGKRKDGQSSRRSCCGMRSALWLAPSGIKVRVQSYVSRILSGRRTDLGERLSGSHGALNAEAHSSTMVKFSRARSSPSQKPFSRRAFDLSAYRIFGCHDSADGVSQQASPIPVSFVDFDFEARILERAGIIIKCLCVQSCALGA